MANTDSKAVYLMSEAAYRKACEKMLSKMTTFHIESTNEYHAHMRNDPIDRPSLGAATPEQAKLFLLCQIVVEIVNMVG